MPCRDQFQGTPCTCQLTVEALLRSGNNLLGTCNETFCRHPVGNHTRDSSHTHTSSLSPRPVEHHTLPRERGKAETPEFPQDLESLTAWLVQQKMDKKWADLLYTNHLLGPSLAAVNDTKLQLLGLPKEERACLLSAIEDLRKGPIAFQPAVPSSQTHELSGGRHSRRRPGGGAGCLLVTTGKWELPGNSWRPTPGVKNEEAYVALGKETGGRYRHLFNISSGMAEAEDGQDYSHSTHWNTMQRELSEEFGWKDGRHCRMGGFRSPDLNIGKGETPIWVGIILPTTSRRDFKANNEMSDLDFFNLSDLLHGHRVTFPGRMGEQLAARTLSGTWKPVTEYAVTTAQAAANKGLLGVYYRNVVVRANQSQHHTERE